MIVDSSALVAILVREPAHEALRARLTEAAEVAVGAPTLAEAALVLGGRLGPAAPTILARLVEDTNLAVLDFGDDHWRVAAQAFLRFGKGRHPAALNLGDCMTYATAKLAGAPLLCLGDDFAQTDLELVPLDVPR